MNFPIPNRNFQINLDQNWSWRSNNIALQSIFQETNLSRNMLVNFPFTGMADNLRHSWNVRDNRRRSRRHSSLNEMRNTLRRVRHEMYEAYDDFDDVRVDLQETKIHLEDAKNEVILSKNGLNNAIRKLDRLANDFRSPRILNCLNMRERNTLQRDLENVRQDIEEAKSRIRDSEYELDEDDNITGVQGQNTGRINMISNVTESIRSVENSEVEENINNNNINNTMTDRCAEGSSSCSICMENPVNAVLYNCGHMCMCYVCSSKLLRRRGDNRRCPMCRAVIRDVIKIYRS